MSLSSNNTRTPSLEQSSGVLDNNERIMSADGSKTYDVELMLSVQKKLLCMPITKQNPEYFDIVKQVNKYLVKYCCHDIVHDLIDIDPDRSKVIEYCTICGNTL